jgi:plasmid stabilization system protein ParE
MGLENWGPGLTGKWVDEIRAHIHTRLSTTPAAFPLAPENEEFETEVRQLIHGRYRILFTMKRNADEVLILRLRGPFTGIERPSDTERW